MRVYVEFELVAYEAAASRATLTPDTSTWYSPAIGVGEPCVGEGGTDSVYRFRRTEEHEKGND